MNHKEELWKRLEELNWNVMLKHSPYAYAVHERYQILRVTPASSNAAAQQEIIGWGKSPKDAVENMVAQQKRGSGE